MGREFQIQLFLEIAFNILYAKEGSHTGKYASTIQPSQIKVYNINVVKLKDI